MSFTRRDGWAKGGTKDRVRATVHRRRAGSVLSSTATPLLGLVMLAVGGQAHAGALNQLVQFDIPAEALDKALLAFGAQDHVSISLAPNAALSLIKSHELKGSYTGEDALSRLLQGSSLSYVVSGSNHDVVDIVSADDTDPQSPPDPGRRRHRASLSDTRSRQSERPRKEESGAAGTPLQAIVVTGTHLKAPNPTQPMIVLTREEIERDGYTTTGQLFRSMPQVFGGGQSGATPDGIYGFGSHADLNTAGETGIDLFGLGASATLVLVDGRRLTPSVYGQFADIAMIPLSAIERIEIITDGSSAIYGADAVAGVVNIILRHDYRGAETDVIAGDTTGGGHQQISVAQSAGTQWSDGSLSGSVQYTHEGALTATDRQNSAASLLSPSDLYPASATYSGILHGEQTVFDGLHLTLDGLASVQHVDRRMNSSISGLQTFSEALHNEGITVAASHKLGARWSVTASFEFGRDEVQNDNIFPAYPTMQLNTSMANDLLTELSPELLLRGTLFHLPGGPARAAIGAAYRSDTFKDRDVDVTSGASAGFGPLHRHVHSEYAELELPVIGPANAVPAIHALDVSLALRRDAYSDVGSTTNPRYGVRWSPVRDISLRTSWGTSFTPPSQLDMIGSLQQTYVDIYPITAPSGVGTVPAFITFGGSQPLRPERAHTLNIGADIDVPGTGAKASIDYIDVLYRGRIVTPPFLPYALTEPNVYGPLITPLADDAASAAYLSAAAARGWIVNDLIGNGSGGVRYVYDTRQRNAQEYLDRGVQLNLSDVQRMGSNTLRVALNALLLSRLESSYGVGTSTAELLNTFGYPARRRARLEMAWERWRWTFGGAVNYTGAYSDNENLPATPIASWTTLDLHFGYRMGGRDSSSLAGLTVDLNVINAMDRAPPFVTRAIVADNVNYDVANANPLGRIINIGITEKW